MAFRVPLPTGSVVDLTLRLCKETDYETLKCEVKHAAENELRGILCYTEEDIVSTDIVGSGCSSIFDAKAGIALNSTFMKLITWYDNETGYSNRLVDFINFMYKKDSEGQCNTPSSPSKNPGNPGKGPSGPAKGLSGPGRGPASPKKAQMDPTPPGIQGLKPVGANPIKSVSGSTNPGKPIFGDSIPGNPQKPTATSKEKPKSIGKGSENKPQPHKK